MNKTGCQSFSGAWRACTSVILVVPSEAENGAAREAATWTERPKAERAGGKRIKSLDLRLVARVKGRFEMSRLRSTCQDGVIWRPQHESVLRRYTLRLPSHLLRVDETDELVR